jgi:hypothetical protein
MQRELFPMPESKFKSGKLIKTKRVGNLLESSYYTEKDKKFYYFFTGSFKKYLSGFWGQISKKQIEENNKSLEEGGQLIGKYKDKRKKYLIIFMTDADRKKTYAFQDSDELKEFDE